MKSYRYKIYWTLESIDKEADIFLWLAERPRDKGATGVAPSALAF